MNEFEVHLSSKDLSAFRRRVLYHFRKKPMHEYMEVLFVRRGVGEYHIHSFHKIKLTKTSRWVVEYDEPEYEALRAKAKALGLEIGSIHTHTMSDTSPSKHDLRSGVETGEPVMGICEVADIGGGKLRTHVDFWIPQMPCKVKQVRGKTVPILDRI